MQAALEGAHHQMVGVHRQLAGTFPSTVTTKPEEVVSTVISSHRLNARPMLSKPGPRFALEAETTAVATSPAGSIGVTNVTAECGRYVRGLPGIRP